MVATAGDPPTVSGAIEVLLANGDGTFTETTQSPIADSGTPEALAYGDFYNKTNSSITINNNTNTITKIIKQNNNKFKNKKTNKKDNIKTTTLIADNFKDNKQIDIAENNKRQHKINV